MLFAIIIGAFIVFAAIYSSNRVGQSQEKKSNTILAKEISILTDSLQGGYASSAVNRINLGQEVILKNRCKDERMNESGGSLDFGSNYLSLSNIKNQKQGEDGFEIKITDKYLFSEKQIQTSKLSVFSFSFNFPFKVSDFLIILGNQDYYCFQDAPDFVMSDLKNISNILFENCSKEEFISVCFDSDNCDISVYSGQTSFLEKYKIGTVKKQGKLLKYSQDLIYAAIFSDPEIYQCGVNRLIYRASILSQVYSEKANLLDLRGCNNKLQDEINNYQQILKESNYEDLFSLNSFSQELNSKNENTLCEAW